MFFKEEKKLIFLIYIPDLFYMQYNSLLEIIGSDPKEFQKLSLAVIDNERLSYRLITHTETREDTIFPFIKYSIQDFFLSKNMIFNEKETHFRMIIYSNGEPSIKASFYENI